MDKLFCDDIISKRVHPFPKVSSPKVNVIVRLEFELAFGDVTVQNIIHYSPLYFVKCFSLNFAKSSTIIAISNNIIKGSSAW